MSSTLTSLSSDRVVSVKYLLFVVIVGGMIWLIAGESRLSKEIAIITSDHTDLLHEVQTLRSMMEKQAAAENHAESDISIKLAGRVEQQVANLDRVLNEHFTTQDKLLKDNLGMLSVHISEQNAVFNRALGKVVPVVMPQEWEDQLSTLEARIIEPSRWPINAIEAQDFLRQTSLLFKGLPPWAEDDFLPRLTIVRWAATAFDCLNKQSNGASLSILIEEMNGLLNTAPEGCSADILEHLKNTSKLLQEKMDKAVLSNAIKLAEKYVQNSINSSSEVSLAAISNVYDILGIYEVGSSEIRTLRSKLHKSIVVQQGKQQTSALMERWIAVQELRNVKPGVFELAVNMLLQEVSTARVALAIERIEQSDLEELETSLRHILIEISAQSLKKEEERQASALCAYQKWALFEIEVFDDTYKELEAEAKKQWEYSKFGRNDWSNDQYEKLSWAMVGHLLPVNLALIDLPIQERYQSAFGRGWKKLDGREDQTMVAKKSVETPKKTIREFMEKQQ